MFGWTFLASDFLVYNWQINSPAILQQPPGVILLHSTKLKLIQPIRFYNSAATHSLVCVWTPVLQQIETEIIMKWLNHQICNFLSWLFKMVDIECKWGKISLCVQWAEKFFVVIFAYQWSNLFIAAVNYRIGMTFHVDNQHRLVYINNGLHLVRKYAQIFVHRHYLLRGSKHFSESVKLE